MIFAIHSTKLSEFTFAAQDWSDVAAQRGTAWSLCVIENLILGAVALSFRSIGIAIAYSWIVYSFQDPPRLSSISRNWRDSHEYPRYLPFAHHRRYLELRSRATNLRSPKASAISREEIEVDVETVGVVTLLKVLGVLAISSFIIAASFFDWQIVGIVAAGVFLLMILIQLPYLPLYFSEAEREEREKLDSQ